MKYGFISAGGGSWYTQTLNLLEKGSRIWVNVPGEGYVGVGLVEEPAKKIADFIARNSDGKEIPILKAPLASPGIGKGAEDPEQSEVLVKVRWINTISLSRAITEKGFFGNQNTVARPTTYKWNFTIERLKERFKIPE